MDFTAKWIWQEQNRYNLYNQTVIFRREFMLDREVAAAELAITADSFYRLYLNGKWINDGPGRGYPEHYNYDLLDVSSYLRQGKNEVRVIAKYFGCETFHQICQQEGFLAQFEFTFADGGNETLISDRNWDVSAAPQWATAAPRIMCQMESIEMYNATLETEMSFAPAAELFSIENAPWQGLMKRDCKLLTKKPFSFTRFFRADVIKTTGIELSIPIRRLLHPGLINDNQNVSTAGGIALIINNFELKKIRITSNEFSVTVNGNSGADSWFELRPGRNLLLALNRSIFSHVPEKDLFIEQTHGFELLNPLDDNVAWPCFLRFPELLTIKSDQVMKIFNPPLLALEKKAKARYEQLAGQVVCEKTFREHLAANAAFIPPECVLPGDFFQPFQKQKIVRDAAPLVEQPENLIYDDPAWTVVQPAPDGDVQLIYDLGQQNIGYYDFELTASAGTVIDIFEIEHIYHDDRLQHTYNYRNGMRYLCKSGLNRFTSLKRRSGRYILIVFRKHNEPVKIHKFQLIESTYPVEYKGDFRCSDDFLNRLWKISAHTLKLCMEDTFTDCPLYEQTLWVGDARNEALFAYPVFGAWDLSKRCIRITAESLEHLPMAGCQTPSAWDTLIPVWSFLWSISIWDYYFETADRDFVREM